MRNPVRCFNSSPEVISLTGQQTVPVIELEDGTGIREEGKVLAERIRSGELFR